MTPALKALFVQGLLDLVIFVILLLGGLWLIDRESQLRDAAVREQTAQLQRSNTILLVSTCNDIENLKDGIRRTALQLGVPANQLTAFAPIIGGDFVDERGRHRWHGCGHYPPPRTSQSPVE